VSAVLLQIAGEEVARLLGDGHDGGDRVGGERGRVPRRVDDVDILGALDAQRRGTDAAAERTGAAPVVDDQAGESV